MTRLILGAGHVGRELLRLWVAQGHRPHATARTPARAAELEALGARPLVCDVTRPDSLDALPEVELAVWSIGHDRSAPPSISEVYVKGLTEALARLRCGRLVYTSSTGVYGSSTGEEVDERTPLSPEEPGGRAVAEAEALLRRARPDAIVLRLAGLYGIGRIIGRKLLEAGAPIEGDPERWINLLHHHDAAAAVALAGERAAPGATYNVADALPVRRREYYAQLAALLGLPVPAFVPRGAGGAGRRVRADLIRTELGFTLRYPTLAEGLPAALHA